MRANRASQQRSGYAAARLCAFAFGGIAALSVSLRCTSPDSLAGTGSQAGNGRITCTIHNSDGTPAAGAAVLLRPKDYLADTAGAAPGKAAGTSRDSRTNAQGVFSLDSIDTGTYCVEVNDGALHAVLIACSVSVTDTLVRIPDDTLKPTGAIKGVLASAPGNSIALYIQVYGLERVCARDTATGGFVIDNIPRGRYTLRMSASSADYRPLELTGVAVASREISDVGKVDFLPLSAWLHSARLYLNTTSAGANVTGTVVNFPVLIRLRTDNFNFNQANEDGGDVRFAKPDGTRLSYETERYDAGSQEGEIWVKIDTVYGNDDSHFISMYWGNRSATSESNGPAVFDTLNGFQGIWHLGESDTLAPDATGNRYDGTGIFTAPAAGMIGNAQHFNGASSFIHMKGTATSRLNFPMSGRYSVSAWVYHDTLADSVTYLIAGKGELQYFIKNFDLEVSTPQHQRQWEFTEYHGGNIWQAVTFVPAAAKAWNYLVGVRDGSNQYLYVNGALVMEGYKVFGTGQGEPPRDTTDDFTIGAFLHPVTDWNQGYAYFNGAIDEVGVSSVPRSADWVKLCYMNQQANDKLVTFGN